MKAHMIDVDRLLATFDRSTVDEIAQIHHSLDIQPNHRYFKNACGWQSRDRNTVGDGRTMSYFKGLLSPVNLAILDYVLRDVDTFKPMTFIDNGAGHGMLSVFLRLLDIDCYNLDNFSQIHSVICDVFRSKLLLATGIEIREITSVVPSAGDINLDVLVNGAIWVDNPELLQHKFEYLLTDVWYINKDISIVPQLTVDYQVVGSYGGIIDVYKRKEI